MSDIDFTLLETLLPKTIPSLTKETKAFLKEASALYEFNTTQLEYFLRNPEVYDINNEFNQDKFINSVREWYKRAREINKLPKNINKQKLTEDLPPPGVLKELKTKDHKELLKTLNPLQLLIYHQKGAKVSPADKKMIHTLIDDYYMPHEVINALLEFVMLTNDRQLPKDYIFKIAGHWQRKGIETVEEAIQEAKMMYQGRRGLNEAEKMVHKQEIKTEIKIPEAIISEENQNEFDSKFEEKVSNQIKKLLDKKIKGLTKLLEKCESPIEQLMVVAWIEFGEMYFKKYGLIIELTPQKYITIKKKKYRADFMLEVWPAGVLNDRKTESVCRVAIECDGHEFHEKTKEQAKNDKERDRAFQSMGIPVVRFTGAEIWKNPSKCIKEALVILEKQIEIKFGTVNFVSAPENNSN